MGRICEQCNKPCSYKSTALCRDCRNASIRRKDFVCTDCHRPTKHYGKELCRLCYMARYNLTEKSKESHRLSEARRRLESPDLVRDQDRARNQTERRKEWRSQYQKEYYARRKEELQAYNREWMRKNREKMNHYAQVYKMRKNGLPHTLTRAEWKQILEAHGYRCAYCGKPGHRFHREHKIPVSRGGGYTLDNIAPACGSCNSRKNNKTPEEFAEYLKTAPKYD